jgi:predicted RND superfamily exporter protein
MYTINFNSRIAESATHSCNVAMSVDFDEQPSWMEITDKFLEFLKANGYVFDINSKLDAVPFNEPAVDHEQSNYETQTEVKRKVRKSKKI